MAARFTGLLLNGAGQKVKQDSELRPECMDVCKQGISQVRELNTPREQDQFEVDQVPKGQAATLLAG